MLATKSSPCWVSAGVMRVKFISNYSRISFESSVQLSTNRKYFSEKFQPRPDVYRSSKKEHLMETPSKDWFQTTSISGDNTPHTEYAHSMKKYESNHLPCGYILLVTFQTDTLWSQWDLTNFVKLAQQVKKQRLRKVNDLPKVINRGLESEPKPSFLVPDPRVLPQQSGS